MIKEIKDISDFLIHSQGIDISIYEDAFLDKTLQKRITVTQCDSMDAYYALLEQSSKEGKLLIDSLQNNYSEFFRNSLTFAVLEHTVLPSLVLKKKQRKEIRIWSTACAGGQEVYSIAMLLDELRNGNKDKFKYRIFATDKSDDQINKARIGRYPSAALNNINFKRADKWFTQQSDIYIIKPELKESIDFSVFDLFDQKYSSPSVSIFGDFDIVVCANLLFYFKPEIRDQILDKVSRSLSEGGYLITGEAEREILMNKNYREFIPQSGIFQRPLITKR
ncbi:MAG: protein-glutamate O-methyltransferase CheR [Candidatus Marinimicrobia bacterium]|nr:protein-glutamate O-methyltransferase CheR [Candidatus Neomarinimicrobiota bacterium]